MSIDRIKQVFNSLTTCSHWSLQVLNINTGKKMGTGYSSREIKIYPEKIVAVLLNDIMKIYVGDNKNRMNSYQDVRTYDGTADGRIIYKLNTDSALISTEYKAFIQTIADPNKENDPFEYKSAYMLKGEVTVNEEEIPIKLVSIQNPTTNLKHKFLHEEGSFREIKEKVLSLKPTMDIIIIDDTVYFLTLAGENLFNMPRSYREVCHNKVGIIEKLDIIHSVESFKLVAESGHNPRRFISFNESKLDALKKKDIRIKISKKFSIPLNSDGDKFDASVCGVPEKIIKFLCNKGMVDPIEDTAVEVDGTKRWN